MTGRKRGTRIAALVAMVFGGLTILSGGTTIMGALDMGAVVPFVLWFNTAAGFFYVTVGVGLWVGRAWAFPLALGVLVATVLVFAAFGLHVVRGGAFEMRTVAAMTLRCAVLAGVALAARHGSKGR
ncbi:hypothetical protein [Phaeovulum vinaykumarii]|uniref:Uncharacterized protein n=1 Tax=Phaeovulum vinaykumarii TaxID=407234 RepID=A0A1N7LRK2_9RHOB|nr:hypothetical protein [Phaeovulum vinaykumarii]SIS76475.1 hypothetical protein SAMN05421795_10429 [Phaeovulum vinaykumarii]SOC07842.1 hypothetical protein SAMN05878426_104225 [Phaeovulum vinaykumarii]